MKSGQLIYAKTNSITAHCSAKAYYLDDYSLLNRIKSCKIFRAFEVRSKNCIAHLQKESNNGRKKNK